MYITLKLIKVTVNVHFGGSFHSVLAFGLCISDRPPLLSCARYWVLVVNSPPQAVCSTCVKYQQNLKTKEHLLQMKIIQVLSKHASDCQL